MSNQQEVKKEIESIDWSEIKNIINTIINLLQGVCDKLPSGNLKNILCGVVSLIKLILAMLPS